MKDDIRRIAQENDLPSKSSKESQDICFIKKPMTTKKYLLEIPNPQQPFAIIDDPVQPFQYDLIVSLKDNAKITDDGAVVGGNKIKIGMPIVLEGFNYRLGGTVSNVIVPGKTQKSKGEALPMAQAVQPGAKPVANAPQQENTVKENDKK